MSSGSQLTHSDKHSSLPSHLRSSPVGRSATSLRVKCGSLEGSELPSTSETRLSPPAVSRAALPIPHAYPTMQRSGRRHHDGGFRLTVIEEHQLALVQVSIRLSQVLEHVSLSVLAHIHQPKRVFSLKQGRIPHADFIYLFTN